LQFLNRIRREQPEAFRWIQQYSFSGYFNWKDSTGIN
jgi:hypothetical protein